MAGVLERGARSCARARDAMTG